MTKVLVVDDEPAILLSTDLLLQDMGFEVLTTSDHTRVLDLLRAERPDVLLQDVRMPGLELDLLVAAIRRDPDVGGTRIVLFSASMELMELRDRLPVDGAIEKPFRPEEALSTIRGTPTVFVGR